MKSHMVFCRYDMNQRKNVVDFCLNKTMYQLDAPALEGSRKAETLTNNESPEILLQLLSFLTPNDKTDSYTIHQAIHNEHMGMQSVTLGTYAERCFESSSWRGRVKQTMY